jgi:hypothetical protein
MRWASRTSRSTCARSSEARWCSRSSADTRTARPRTRARPATERSGSTRSSPSPSGRGPTVCGPGTTLGSSSAMGFASSPARSILRRISRTCSRPWRRRSSSASRFRSATRRGGDARRGGACRPRGGFSQGEPRGVLPRGRRLPQIPRAPGHPQPGRRHPRRRRTVARPSRRVLALHAGPAARPPGRHRHAAVRPTHREVLEHGRRGPARGARNVTR